jgi:hypothetical protein
MKIALVVWGGGFWVELGGKTLGLMGNEKKRVQLICKSLFNRDWMKRKL